MCEHCKHHHHMGPEGPMFHEENSSNFISGVIFGALLGTAAGILLAPSSGFQTRRRLKVKSRELMERGKETLEEVREEVKDKIYQAESKLEELKEKAEPVLEELDNKIDDAVNRLEEEKDIMMDTIEESADNLDEKAKKLKNRFFKGIK